MNPTFATLALWIIVMVLLANLLLPVLLDVVQAIADVAGRLR